ncbi:MAG: ferredoxin [Gallionellales bacterium RIFCSPLOWO2_12_FULL_59_22]|nr:MAG: ferredoxin [Gallionellales bacterium RIFCSPLOWO2_02_FULL_59_110]OGT01959.1 MAG: ferredoxin [Gallionellales bacterium RIFCSPLOWO2_02_58_13]OGT10919.1 MAG: ferredoxin [Gallionellales bacterium RIFCSPLOWO2_12_FULL_59_22]
MSITTHEKGRPAALTVNGLAIEASTDMTLVEAAWHGGVPRITNIGCMEGVCGSCRVMLRRGKEVSVGLACQTFVEDGIEVVFMPPASVPQHHYDIGDLKDGWDIHARFHKIFHEAARCRHCHGCVAACPKGIKVEDGVAQAAAGRYREAGETFFECIMCELCDAACPELIAPAHVGLFSRRVTAHFHLRPPNLIHRLEELRQARTATPQDKKDDE